MRRYNKFGIRTDINVASRRRFRALNAMQGLHPRAHSAANTIAAAWNRRSWAPGRRLPSLLARRFYRRAHN